MILVDTLIKFLEKRGVDKTLIDDDAAMELAAELERKFNNIDKHTIWSTEAAKLLEQAVEELEPYKKVLALEDAELGSKGLGEIELGNLIFKIEELLIKYKL